MWWSRVLLLLLVSLLAGCGFQARGAAQFPSALAAVYVDGVNRYSPFYQELTTAIRASGNPLAANANVADTVIRVTRDETGQRVLSVSPRNVPREYEIFYLVNYEVFSGGERVLEPQALTRTRNYTYDETQVLGKESEEDMLRRALARDLVSSVIRRISILN